LTRLIRSASMAAQSGGAALAWAQPQHTNLRGSVTSFDGKTIVVATRVQVSNHGVKPTQ